MLLDVLLDFNWSTSSIGIYCNNSDKYHARCDIPICDLFDGKIDKKLIMRDRIRELVTKTYQLIILDSI